MHDYYGDENVLNTLTLKTEGTKSVIQVCCKGLGINNDDAQYLADLVPFERGKNWSLSDCFNGNEDENRPPQVEFINEVAKYDGLKETLLKIEGLISGRSIHASASYIFDAGYIAQNSKMRAPNGTTITAYNMEDSDYMGGLKVDTLTIEMLDKLHKAIDLLIDAKVIEDKGSYKANYDAYLHPDVLDYNDYKMWNLLDQNQILDAFQFDSAMGQQVIIKTQPRSMLELSTANSLMRLMAQDDATEAPMDTYRRYKDNIQLWYDEMEQWGLNRHEQEIMKKHLGSLYGVADTQESIMEMSMDPEISGFDVVLANKLRKSVAKKKKDLIVAVHDKFYKKGKDLGTSDALLNYVWGQQIKRQLGYSFSKNHCMPYTVICLQCMNIVKRYGSIYWNCACLIVNSGSTDEEDVENNGGVNYGRIAKAMGNMMQHGIKIALPDLNRVHFGFYPDVADGEIVYGLKPIQGLGSKVAKAIIDYAPYTSSKQFYEKMQQFKEDADENKFGDTAMISLIKAGCFDTIDNKPREEIMKDFIRSISSPITSLKISNIEDMKRLGLLSEDQVKYEYRLYRFRNYVFQKQFYSHQTGKSPTTAYYFLDRTYAEPYFKENFIELMQENKDYEYAENGLIAVKRGSFDRVFDKLMKDFRENYLSSQEILNKINENRFNDKWKEKAQGNLSKWEFDSMCFYYHPHVLLAADIQKNELANFEELPLQPEGVATYYFRGQEKIRFGLSKICGTVLDKNKNKHTVDILTPTGVVTLKFYKGQFSFYDRQISKTNPDGSKTVMEKSWFSRGTNLLVTGFRRDQQFVPRVYKDSVYNHSLQLIKGIDKNGMLELVSDRIEVDSTNDVAV